MKLNIEDNKKFSKKSGDKNKIHIDIEHAKKFFIKKPIVHGANVVIKAFQQKKFIKKKLSFLEIYFKDFININEEFKIFSKKNHILIKGLYGNKIEIYKNFFHTKSLLNEKEIIKGLMFISRYVGNVSPGQNSLIQQIKFRNTEKAFSSRIIKKRKINKNVTIITYCYKNLIAEVTALKLQPYKNQVSKNFIKNKKIIKLIKNKKIIIFGKNSDLGNFLFKSNLKKFCKITLVSSKNLTMESLEVNLKKIKPDFIFYFFSPKIINGNNKKIYQNYLNTYFNIPKKIFFIASKYKKSVRIFYPSTIFINESQKYKYLRSYIDAKKKSENEFKKKIYINNFFVTRLPQLKTRSNYNPFLGIYTGKGLNYLSNVLLNFFK